MSPRSEDSLGRPVAHAVLNKTTREIWRRGEVYADGGKVSAVPSWGITTPRQHMTCPILRDPLPYPPVMLDPIEQNN